LYDISLEKSSTAPLALANFPPYGMIKKKAVK
jgi:hypothetical protein